MTFLTPERVEMPHGVGVSCISCGGGNEGQGLEQAQHMEAEHMGAKHEDVLGCVAV